MGFRKDFIWGAATASYQIEGAALEDGRGKSVWDVFSHTPGKVYRGHTGDIACDHYHRVDEDVALMADMGLKHYRFSVSWTRLLPEGTGAVNEKGVAFYDRLIDCLLKHGITPWMTLFHWDYPATLNARGAWGNPDSVGWFENYTELIARRYGDRVKHFFTLNEPQCFIGMGYYGTNHAPGLAFPNEAVVPMTHRVLLAHGAASRILRAEVPDCRLGYAPCAFARVPATSSPEDIEAARRDYFAVGDHPYWPFNVSWWSDPVMLGRYPEDGLAHYGHLLPPGWEKDLPLIHEKPDYYGQNIYCGTIIKAADNPRGCEEVLPPPGNPRTAIGWDITPEALYWGPRMLYERYHTPIVITENGMSGHDFPSADGKVHDPYRIEYMRRYLAAYRRAAEDGVDAAGYFAWSLMDNFEWAYGYSERFGLIYVDYADNCRRIKKDSADYYRAVMAANGETL